MGLHNFTFKKWLNKYGIGQNNSYLKEVEVFLIRCDWMARSADGKIDQRDKEAYTDALSDATDGIKKSELYEVLVKYGWTQDQTKVMVLRVIPSFILLIFSAIYHTFYETAESSLAKNIVANIFAFLVVYDAIWSVLMTFANGV